MQSADVIQMPIVKNIISSAEFKIKKLTGVDICLVPAGLSRNTIASSKLVLQELVEDFFECKWKNVVTKGRRRDLVRARYFYAWVNIKILNQTYAITGVELGGRDHTTIINAINACSKYLKDNLAVGMELTQFIEEYNKRISDPQQTEI